MYSNSHKSVCSVGLMYSNSQTSCHSVKVIYSNSQKSCCSVKVMCALTSCCHVFFSSTACHWYCTVGYWGCRNWGPWLRTQSYQRFSLFKSGVGQNISLHPTSTDRNSISPISAFSIYSASVVVFPQSSSSVSLYQTCHFFPNCWKRLCCISFTAICSPTTSLRPSSLPSMQLL